VIANGSKDPSASSASMNADPHIATSENNKSQSAGRGGRIIG
jgi:hypothetical protein